jgi:hypothetical protein
LAGVHGEVFDEVMATGAVVTGRTTFESAGGWGDDHHDGVPIFVLSRREPDSEMGQWPLVTYVTDVRTAMTEAKEAAGDKNVLVHGAGTAQLALPDAGLPRPSGHGAPEQRERADLFVGQLLGPRAKDLELLPVVGRLDAASAPSLAHLRFPPRSALRCCGNGRTPRRLSPR